MAVRKEFAPVKLERLETASLRARALAAIKANITTGALRAGELYSVGRIAASLGVSATPVREALLDLASEGLVELVRNRGFRVPVLSEHDLDEIFEVRVLLEVPSLTRLAGHLDEDTITESRYLAEQNERAVREGDIPRFLETYRLFHARLLEPLGNRRIVDLILRLRDVTRLTGLTALSGSPQLLTSSREHRELIDALARGNQSAVKTLITKHLKHTRGMWAGHDESQSGETPAGAADLDD